MCYTQPRHDKAEHAHWTVVGIHEGTRSGNTTSREMLCWACSPCNRAGRAHRAGEAYIHSLVSHEGKDLRSQFMSSTHPHPRVSRCYLLFRRLGGQPLGTENEEFLTKIRRIHAILSHELGLQTYISTSESFL